MAFLFFLYQLNNPRLSNDLPIVCGGHGLQLAVHLIRPFLKRVCIIVKNTKENTPPLSQNNDLREQIERTVGEVVPQANRQLVIERVVTLMSKESFSGPLPHPKHLSEYEKISPGAADRIITMAEESQEHIQELDKKNYFL